MTGLYAIADVEVLAAQRMKLRDFAEELRDAGVKTVQLRDKVGTTEEVLGRAEELSEIFEGSGTLLVMNDRIDSMLLAGWDAVHVGQQDMNPEDVRIVVGDGRVIGVSTHTLHQVWEAEQGVADYVAIGPVFQTATKQDAREAVGLNGVSMARTRTTKPLVAIGGITLENCRSVMQAGADAVAVISGLFVSGERVGKTSRRYLDLLQ